MTLILPGQPIPPPGQPQNPFTIAVDPRTGSTVVKHQISGAEAVFHARGAVGIKVAEGSYFQILPDGTFEINAKRLVVLTEEPPQFLAKSSASPDTDPPKPSCETGDCP